MCAVDCIVIGWSLYGREKIHMCDIYVGRI